MKQPCDTCRLSHTLSLRHAHAAPSLQGRGDMLTYNQRLAVETAPSWLTMLVYTSSPPPCPCICCCLLLPSDIIHCVVLTVAVLPLAGELEVRSQRLSVPVGQRIPLALFLELWARMEVKNVRLSLQHRPASLSLCESVYRASCLP